MPQPRPVTNPAFGARLRDLRAGRRLSLRRLADLVHYSHGYIWDLEEGRKSPSVEAAADLDRVLDAGGQLAALVTIEPAELAAPDPLHRVEQLRRVVTEAISSSVMSEASIEDWERTALEYGRATRYRPAGALLDDLAADFTELTRQLERRHPSSTLLRLTRVTAQMAGLMFLTLIKLDQRGPARAWARTAYVAADEAGDPLLRSWVRAQEAYVHFYCGDLGEALAVAGHAREVAGRAPGVGVALAAALEARAHGVLGNAGATYAAVDAAETALAGLDADSVTASAFGYSEAQLRFHAGNAYTHLGDTAAAGQAHTTALALYDRGDYLDRALVHLDRIDCLARDGDVAGAMAYGTTELAALTGEQRAGMINIRAGEVLAGLPPQQRALPAAAGFRDMLMTSEETR
jgi:transcriptional regulator with XRE-family HTH domain